MSVRKKEPVLDVIVNIGELFLLSQWAQLAVGSGRPQIMQPLDQEYMHTPTHVLMLLSLLHSYRYICMYIGDIF